jgi:hypothetical protein
VPLAVAQKAAYLEKVVLRSPELRFSALAGMVLCLAVAGGASGPSTPASPVVFVYRARIPLGSETFAVQPWRSVLTVMASAENPHFEGWRRETHADKELLLDASGRPVRFFPRHIDFRISVGTRTHVSDIEPFPIQAGLALNDYLLGLRFRLKIFHGLQQTVVEPDEVALIGVPSDVPYDERIYRASFQLPRVPIEDRIVLEVLTPQGERLCKFHLDLG